MKIIGDMNPVDFINSLANIIIEKFGDNVTINESKYNLKFDIVFENQETTEKENEEMKKEIMEELNKLGITEINELDKEIEKKKYVIKVELFESFNKGILLYLLKRE